MAIKDSITLDELWDALDAFGEHLPTAEQAKDESNTKRFLIEPFLDKILGISTQDPSQVESEVSTGGDLPRKADFALKREGAYWCAVEAKKLADKQLGRYWDQLNRYARLGSTFQDVHFFVLTNGRIWLWYQRRGHDEISKEPFLNHDATLTTEEACQWYSIVRNSNDVEDLIHAARKLHYADTVRSWLKSLMDPSNLTLESLLKDRAFSSLWNENQRKTNLQIQERSGILRDVWPDAIAGIFIDSRSLPPEDVNAWQLSTKSGWNTCKSQEDLFVAVIRALAARYPTGAADWYQLIAKEIKWIFSNDDRPSIDSLKARDLDDGYSANVASMGKEKKEERLQYLVDDIRNRADQDLHLDISWK